MHSLIRAFASRSIILWLLSYWLELLSLKGDCPEACLSLLCQNTILLEISCHSSYIQDKIKKEGKAQESIQSSTTPDPGYQWESDNFTIGHHKRVPRGQPCQTYA